MKKLNNKQILQKAYDILSVEYKAMDCGEIEFFCNQCRVNEFLNKFKSLIEHYNEETE